MRAHSRFSAGLRIGAAVLAAVIFLTACGAGPGSSRQAADKAEKSPGAEDSLWYRSLLEGEDRACYEAFERAADSIWSSDPVPIPGGKENTAEIAVPELDKVYQAFLYDHPQLFWIAGTYSYRVSRTDGGTEYADAVLLIPLADSASELEQMNREFEAAAEDVLKEAGQSGSKEELAEKIYDILARNTEYAEEAVYDESFVHEHTAYGAIAGKRAVCDGYALAYKYLLNRCGIPCVLIPGESEGMPHVWNTVFWGGAWHETDVTWDAASAGNNKRQYFDLTTEEMNKDHTREPGTVAELAPVSGSASN